MRFISDWICDKFAPVMRHSLRNSLVASIMCTLWIVLAICSLAGSIIVMIYGSTVWLVVAIVWGLYTLLSILAVGSDIVSDTTTRYFDRETWWVESLHLGPILVGIIMSVIFWVFSGMKKLQLSS